MVENPAAESATRLVALNSLLDAGDKGLLPTLKVLLNADAAIRKAAIQGMAQYDNPQVAPALLEAYSRFAEPERRLALSTLCARVSSAKALLSAIAEKRIDGTDLTGDLVAQLQFLGSKEIDATLEKVWGKVSASPKEKLVLIEDLKSILANGSQKFDHELGRAIFAKTCMKCHQLYGVGYKIGPDLTGSNRGDLDYLLSNIVDPSAVMAKEYRPTILLTEDGRVINGLLKEENAKSITLQTTDALVTIPKIEIEQRRESDKSMMPDGQLEQMKPQQVIDLIKYLRTTEQVEIAQ